jgi:hypothetical protein
MIMTANGVELHADIRGEGTPVPLRHGWPDSSARWRNQIPFLTAHRFRTIAPDLRGCAPPANSPRAGGGMRRSPAPATGFRWTLRTGSMNSCPAGFLKFMIPEVPQAFDGICNVARAQRIRWTAPKSWLACVQPGCGAHDRLAGVAGWRLGC